MNPQILHIIYLLCSGAQACQDNYINCIQEERTTAIRFDEIKDEDAYLVRCIRQIQGGGYL